MGDSAHAAAVVGAIAPLVLHPAGRLDEIPESAPTPWVQPIPAVVNDAAVSLHLPARSWITPSRTSHESVESVFSDVFPTLGIEADASSSHLAQGTGLRTITAPVLAPPPSTDAFSAETSKESTGARDVSSALPLSNAGGGKGAVVDTRAAMPTDPPVTATPSSPAPANSVKNNASANSAGVPVPSTPVRKPMPPQVRALREPLERCLKQHEQIRLNTKDDGCWSIMHSFLGWGPSTEIHVGGPRGTRVNAIQWLTQNQPCMGRPLFYLTEDRLRGREGPGFQGHPAQFLAMLAQTGIDPSYPIKVGGRAFTVADLVSEEQKTCFQDTELTFKLIGLSHYLSTDAEWQNERNEAWNFPRIVQIELAQPVNGAACGGTHRLMGLTFSLAKRKQEGLPIEGHWWRAQKYIEDYQKYVLTLQNRDGSFSSDWFKKKSDWGDMDRRLQTTGHMLEWLVYSLPDDGLYHPQVVSAVNYLTTVLTQHRYHEWEVGPKGHAIRSLRLYYTRLFQTTTEAASPVARRGAAVGVK